MSLMLFDVCSLYPNAVIAIICLYNEQKILTTTIVVCSSTCLLIKKIPLGIVLNSTARGGNFLFVMYQSDPISQ